MKTESFSYKGYAGSSEFSHEDRCLVGQILYIDDLILYEGATYDELENAFQSSVDEYLEFCNRVGKEPQKAYSGSFNIRVGAELHAQAARKANQMGIKLNEFVRQAIEQKTSTNTAVVANAIVSTGTDWIFPTGPTTYAGTATGSGSAAVFPHAAIRVLDQDRRLLLAPDQIDVSARSATTSYVDVSSKKPTLRRVA